ncbi:MAG: terminase large subunit [Salinarimonas sp.]
MTTTFPHWVFDDTPIPDPFGYGERAVAFLRALRHPKSRLPGRAFQLDAWQERIVRRIYGPCDEQGRRIVRNVLMLLPRGNRKTSLGAALALLHTFGPERVPGGQIVVGAGDRKQARIAYDEALGIVGAHPKISAAMQPQDFKSRIVHRGSRAVFEALSADAGTQHGRTPSFALIDELHAWKKRDLFDVIRTGLTKTAGSLMMVISTAGRGQEHIAHELYDYGRRVARGEIDDPGTLPVLFEADADDDWRDEALWHRVNPGLAQGYPDLEGLRQLAREAENRPSDRDAFRQLHLNMWLDHSESPFVEMAVFDRGAAPVDVEALRGAPCWLGVDLSTVSDLTAIVAAFRTGDDEFSVVPWFACPGDNLRIRADRDGVPYPRWAEEGFLEPTPGNVVDYRRVEERIRELCDAFDVREIAFDPYLGRVMMANLAEDGFPVVEFRQGWVSMSPAIQTLERAIVSGNFKHGAHPVLRWNFENIAVHDDGKGNRTFHKGKSRDRIDGAVACAMAVQRAAVGDDTSSIYTTSERAGGLLVF